MEFPFVEIAITSQAGVVRQIEIHTVINNNLSNGDKHFR